MHDPTEPDRYEILNGPGEGRRSPRKKPSDKKKIAVIAASALVAALAVGGAGYVLTAGPGEPGTPTQQSQQAGPGQDEGEPLEDAADEAADEATGGDADTDLPEEEAAEMGDVAVGDTSGNTGNGNTGNGNTGNGTTGNSRGGGDSGDDSSGKSTASRDGAKQNDGAKKPTTAAKPPPAEAGDNPADGPAGAVNGQCATSGC